MAPVGIIFYLCMDGIESESRLDRLAKSGYWPAQARKFFEEKEYARAAELCLRMLEEDPDTISGRTILALALYEAGQWDQARDQFLEVLKRDPEHLVAMKHLGDIVFHEGQHAVAMAYYRRVQETDPGCAGLASPIEREPKFPTRQLTLKHSGEGPADREETVLQEPPFVTETIGDIYRDQGYFRLAGDVYRRLLRGSGSSRIAEKLREVEKVLTNKEEKNENSSR